MVVEMGWWAMLVSNQWPLPCEGKNIDFLIARCCNGFPTKVLNIMWLRAFYRFYRVQEILRFWIISDTKMTTGELPI